MTELRQIITNLRTFDSYLDQFLNQKAEEFNNLLKENAALKAELEKLKASK